MIPNRTNPVKRLIFVALSSLILFVIMYLMTNNSNNMAFHNFMKDNFGMTNKWSTSFGPKWFVDICRNVSALGGHIDFILIVGFVSSFLFFLRERKIFFEFLITIGGAIIILFILKFTMNNNSPDYLLNILFSDGFGFPSGHALISLVLYSSLAKYSGRKLIYTKARYVIYIFATILITLIGLSRLFTSHTLTEVIAGWSAGLFWLSIVNYIFRKNSARWKRI
ncbi:MAG: phosphatase PAP2 family protein [Ignavibacteriaceae bacterium]